MNMLSLIRKLKLHQGRVYTAYLTPQEAKVLADAGCVFGKEDRKTLDNLLSVNDTKPRAWFFALNRAMSTAMKNIY